LPWPVNSDQKPDRAAPGADAGRAGRVTGVSAACRSAGPPAGTGVPRMHYRHQPPGPRTVVLCGAGPGVAREGARTLSRQQRAGGARDAVNGPGDRTVSLVRDRGGCARRQAAGPVRGIRGRRARHLCPLSSPPAPRRQGAHVRGFPGGAVCQRGGVAGPTAALPQRWRYRGQRCAVRSG